MAEDKLIGISLEWICLNYAHLDGVPAAEGTVKLVGGEQQLLSEAV